jgi:hypothetical protein
VVSFSSLSIFASVADLTGSIIASVIIKGYKALVSILDVNRFRKALIIFFVMCNIAFHVIELFYYCHRSPRQLEVYRPIISASGR